MIPASGEQLAQSRPSGTTAVTALSTNGIRLEVTLVIVANNSTNARKFSIYHDDDGTTYDATTVLYEDNAIAANTTTRLVFEIGSGIMVKPGGAIGVKTDAANELTFTFYGHSASIA